MTPESDVLASVVKYLQYHPQVVWAARMNTGGGRLVRGQSASQFIKFGFAGSPDIHGMLKGGQALYVECKSEKGRLSPAQAAFLDMVRAGGGIAIVARSIDDVAKVLS